MSSRGALTSAVLRMAVVLTTASAILIAATIGPAGASCAPALTITDALAQADIVVVGTVTAARSHDRIATVGVEEKWKGDVAERLEVYGGPSSDNSATSVDRSWQVGTRYLLFVREPGAHGFSSTFGGRYEDSACSNSRPWIADLAQYRPATATLTGGPTTVPAPVRRGDARPGSAVARNSGPGRSIAIAIGVLVAATVLALAVRRRSRRAKRRSNPE